MVSDSDRLSASNGKHCFTHQIQKLLLTFSSKGIRLKCSSKDEKETIKFSHVICYIEL